MNDPVIGAIEYMWDHYSEPITLDRLANCAFLSRFYFSRLFRSRTGTSPGRFLAAVRLAKSKDLLLFTERRIGDIACSVGYDSIGTFTSRFTRSVGMSPGKYRELCRRGLPDWPRASRRPSTSDCAYIAGEITYPAQPGGNLRVYVAVFDSPIPQGLPSACDCLSDGGRFGLNVPSGTWYLRAVAVAPPSDSPLGFYPLTRRPAFLGAAGPFQSTPGYFIESPIEMWEPRPVDLPVLLALPELDNVPLDPSAEAAALPVRLPAAI